MATWPETEPTATCVPSGDQARQVLKSFSLPCQMNSTGRSLVLVGSMVLTRESGGGDWARCWDRIGFGGGKTAIEKIPDPRLEYFLADVGEGKRDGEDQTQPREVGKITARKSGQQMPVDDALGRTSEDVEAVGNKTNRCEAGEPQVRAAQRPKE